MALIRRNSIKNCDVEFQDISHADIIWGKDIAILKGKPARASSKQVRVPGLIPMPQLGKEKYKNVILDIDVMHVNGCLYDK